MADPEESISPPEDVQYVREHGGPNVTIRVFEGQGHNLHRTDFERMIREVDAFLSVS